MGKNWLNLMNFLISIEIIFNRLVEEKPYECNNAKEKIYPINLAYEFKTEGTIPKHFSNHQNQIDLFKNLRDGNINPKKH